MFFSRHSDNEQIFRWWYEGWEYVPALYYQGRKASLFKLFSNITALGYKAVLE